MNLHTFIKKSKDYISCFVNYGAAVIVAPFAKNKEKYKDLWLIAERGIDARDNAYYLFKYITANHPEINIAYAITKDSADRERVEKLGRIINHNSFEHYISLVLSKVKISTHIMGYTPYIDFFVKADKKGIIKGKKIFLQHGIIKDNLTYLYNNNVNLDLFVCSAKPEYEYVKSLYGYKDNVVQMLGLCRYDALYKNEQPTKKVLLMPTWRYNLQGADKKEFVKSEYYKVYSNFLASEKLKNVLEKYNYELLFYPHIEFQRFIDTFKGCERVKIVTFNDSTVQNLLIKSDVLITDFSSVFFDYGYMEKPMIFYQFDKESFRQQHYEEGYFDYERDGFGEILYDENDVIDELDRILENGCVLDDKYRKRIDKFFTLRDENNSQRNFEAIKEICDRG